MISDSEKENIGQLLNLLAIKYNVASFIDTDPIQFPRRYSKKQDIEIAALLISLITWGNRRQILKSGEKLFERMPEGPFAYIINKDWIKETKQRTNIHRTFFSDDLTWICGCLYEYYTTNDSLEKLFENGVLTGLDELARLLSSRHMASPKTGSPCKRTNLMLRWLVRDDGIVDLGIWKTIRPADLIIPLDVHVGRVGRTIWNDLQKTERMTTALQITEKLKEYKPEDPCFYDYALFGAGIEGLNLNKVQY